MSVQNRPVHDRPLVTDLFITAPLLQTTFITAHVHSRTIMNVVSYESSLL